MERVKAIQAQANAEILKIIVPQAFTSGDIMDKGAGQIDEWKLTKFTGKSMLSLLYFRHRGEHDGIRFYKEFVDHFLRGSHSIDGSGLKMLENIAIGMSGGGGSKRIVRRPGWLGRNITKRGWERKAEREQAQVIE